MKKNSLRGERHCKSSGPCSRTEHNVPGQLGLETGPLPKDKSAYATAPPSIKSNKSKEAKWNDRGETSAGFRRVSYHACARVSLTTSDVFVTCETTRRTGLRACHVFDLLCNQSSLLSVRDGFTNVPEVVFPVVNISILKIVYIQFYL